VNRIRVCLLVDTVAFSAGTERQVIETARRLNKDKFDVHVVCLEPSSQLDSLSACCRTAVFPLVRVYSLPGIRQLVRLRRYLERYRMDIVHAFMNRTGMCAVVSSLGSDRIVITSRLNTGYWYTPLSKLQFRLMNLATTRIMANSEEARRIAMEAERLPREKVDVLYQGVDMDVYRPGGGDPGAYERLGVPQHARIVGMVANLRPVKDIPLFLRAAAIVARQCHDTVFLIAGSGEQLSELRELAAALSLQDRVFFTEGRGRVADYLSRMSIGCMTSLSEGFSNAILEYMAAGIPVVATDVGGNREAIADGETGFLVGQRSPEEIARMLLILLTDEDRRREMGDQALARCAERFELSRTIVELEKYYTRIARYPNGAHVVPAG
jgi:glycosyltransferase involved in cell wall biosynthesis